MKYSFHPAARNEFISAVEYYEDCLDGLGLAYTREVYLAI